MIYSIVPQEYVFGDFRGDKTEALPIKNGVIEYRTTPKGREITRIISTDLKDYLKPEYGLGNIINQSWGAIWQKERKVKPHLPRLQ